jgi:hypothetical protein
MPILVQFHPNPPPVQAKQTPIAEKSINLLFNEVKWDTWDRPDSLENADQCARRKAGTATNSRLWNWLAVPGLPTPS